MKSKKLITINTPKIRLNEGEVFGITGNCKGHTCLGRQLEQNSGLQCRKRGRDKNHCHSGQIAEAADEGGRNSNSCIFTPDRRQLRNRRIPRPQKNDRLDRKDRTSRNTDSSDQRHDNDRHLGRFIPIQCQFNFCPASSIHQPHGGRKPCRKS